MQSCLWFICKSQRSALAPSVMLFTAIYCRSNKDPEYQPSSAAILTFLLYCKNEQGWNKLFKVFRGLKIRSSLRNVIARTKTNKCLSCVLLVCLLCYMVWIFWAQIKFSFVVLSAKVHLSMFLWLMQKCFPIIENNVSRAVNLSNVMVQQHQSLVIINNI